MFVRYLMMDTILPLIPSCPSVQMICTNGDTSKNTQRLRREVLSLSRWIKYIMVIAWIKSQLIWLHLETIVRLLFQHLNPPTKIPELQIPLCIPAGCLLNVLLLFTVAMVTPSDFLPRGQAGVTVSYFIAALLSFAVLAPLSFDRWGQFSIWTRWQW